MNHSLNFNHRLLFCKPSFAQRALAFVLAFLCLQACSNSLAATQGMASDTEAPKLEHLANSTQVSGAIAMKQAKVELDIFSGREPPTWFLSEAETETLHRLLSQLPKKQPMEFEDKLGYRGFLVEVPDSQSQKPIVLRVFNGVIQSETNRSTQFLTDPHRDVERWLLNSGKSHLSPDLYGIVEATL